jgi:hypothetical protein
MRFDCFILFLLSDLAENIAGGLPVSPWIPSAWSPYSWPGISGGCGNPLSFFFIGPGEGKLRENNDEFER